MTTGLPMDRRPDPRLPQDFWSALHRQTMNELLGTQIAKPPSDSTFRLLLAQLDVESFETLLQDWMSTQIGEAEPIDTLVCDGKTLRGSIDETATGAARFIAQVSLRAALKWSDRGARPRL
jgi:hypothetical protein